jgi:NAD(P)-dependent dehydrogenase (short-subunit alcohol dehydrogenase family)
VIILALVVQWSFIQPGYEHDHHLLSTLSRAPSSNSMEHLDVVITGVTAGLGKELTSVLMESGATVYAIARSKEKLDKLGEDLKDKKGKMIPIVCDLQDLTSVSKAADAVLESVGKGKIDYLINNAGMHYGNPFDTKSIDIAASKSDGMDKVRGEVVLVLYSRHRFSIV